MASVAQPSAPNTQNVTSHHALRKASTESSASAAAAQPPRIRRSARGRLAAARRTATTTPTVRTSQPSNQPMPVRLSGTKNARPRAPARTAAGTAHPCPTGGPGHQDFRSDGGRGTDVKANGGGAGASPGPTRDGVAGRPGEPSGRVPPSGAAGVGVGDVVAAAAAAGGVDAAGGVGVAGGVAAVAGVSAAVSAGGVAAAGVDVRVPAGVTPGSVGCATGRNSA